MGSFGARAFFMNSGVVPDVASVQKGSITIPSGSATATSTITSIDTTKSIVLLNGATHSSSGVDSHVTIEITNATTVTASRIAGFTLTTVVDFLVITFNNVKSLQTGTISIGNGVTSVTATITSVNTAKATVIYQGERVEASDEDVRRGRIELTNATTVTAYIGVASTSPQGAMQLPYIVIEFN